MGIVWITGGYVAISLMLYFVLRAKCKKNAVFKAPKNRWIFYALSFTWGLPTVVVGGLVALFIRLKGYKPQRYGWEWCFEIPGITWGLELGVFFIAPKSVINESTKWHEHGHGIQNMYLGLFNPLVVFLPSVLRFWYRRIRKLIGKPCKARYADIWFEKSAYETGYALIQKLEKPKKNNIHNN